MQGTQSRILYRRSNGQPLSIRDDNRLGSGGEGDIHALNELPDLVAKVYHNPSGSIGAKLTLMVDTPPTMPTSGGHVPIAWPLDTLHSALPANTGNTVGFLMHKVSSMQPVNQCYNPAARKRNFPHFTYRHLCAVAINIAIAVNAVHDRNYVIGDINESNIMINNSGLVTLIDTDSFQVIDQSDGTIYRSPVGKPEYTPRELQGHSFDAVDRDQYHDRFGLGVIIFQLLMEGRHPYTGRYTGRGEPPAIEDNISSGHFLHSEGRSVPLIEGPGYMPWRALDGAVAELFRLCFERGHDNQIVRPTAFQWEETITQAVQSTVTCSRNSNHMYFGHNPTCPWCDRRNMLRGRDPFPETPGPEPLFMRDAIGDSASHASGRAQSPHQPQPSPAPRTHPQTQAQSRSAFRGIPMPSGSRLAWAALLLIVIGIGLFSLDVVRIDDFLEFDPFGPDAPGFIPTGGGPTSSLPVPSTSTPAPGQAVVALLPTETPIPPPTVEPSPTATPLPTFTPVPTPTPYPIQPTFTPLPTSTPRPTATRTATPSPTATPEPTATPVRTSTNTPTPIPTPTPVPTLTPTLTPTPILPDLLIETVSVSPETPDIWEEVAFTGIVRNLGTATASEFTLALYDGGVLLDESKVNRLIPDGEKEVTLVWRAEAEAKTLSVVVDRDDRIIESYEGNNEATYKVEPVLPPYAVDKVTWDPPSPATNEEVTFWAHIENTSAFSHEYAAGVIFYLDGVYHSGVELDRRFNAGQTKQVRSTEWEAQKGHHEITAVVYPLVYLDPKSNPSSWDEYDGRYAIAEDSVSYDATRLPNLVVDKVEFSEDPVSNTDTVYLNLYIVIANEAGQDGKRPPDVDDSFDVLIEFVKGPMCPLRRGRIPCTEEITIDGLRGGSTKTLTVEGEFPVPLPRRGDVHIYEVYIFVDSNNEVEESSEGDNERRRTYRVRR